MCFKLNTARISPTGMDSFEGGLLKRSICLNIISKEKKGYRRAMGGFFLKESCVRNSWTLACFVLKHGC